MVADPTIFYNAEQYVEMENEAETKSELFNGQIYAMAGASPTHALITANIIGALQPQLRGKPCRTFNSDLRVCE